LRSKLNHAVEATDVKLAASKTALGLHSGFTLPENLLADNENVFTVFTFFSQDVKKLSLRFQKCCLLKEYFPGLIVS